MGNLGYPTDINPPSGMPTNINPPDTNRSPSLAGRLYNMGITGNQKATQNRESQNAGGLYPPVVNPSGTSTVGVSGGLLGSPGATPSAAFDITKNLPPWAYPFYTQRWAFPWLYPQG
jgi:hypothetical protein